MFCLSTVATVVIMRAAAAAAATRGSEDSVAGDLTKGVVESESGVNTVINLRWTKSKPIGWSPGGREGVINVVLLFLFVSFSKVAVSSIM